jgi:NADPH:quinone reductase-like Zn-dependent oxidoreductase
MIRSRWAGAIDTVGGNTLATLVKACASNGSVAACGLVGSPRLQTTVYPFIINGVNLLGVDSATCPMPLRLQVWQQLSATAWGAGTLEKMATLCSLDTVNDYIDQILAGKVTGRVVVAHA